MITWIVLLVIFFLVMSTEYYAWRTGVPTVASFRKVRGVMLDVLKRHHAEYKGSELYTIIDLGSGHGQLATLIARALPDAKVTGIEISFVAWFISYARRLLGGPANLQFKCVDFWPYDISKLDAVIIFLTSNLIERMAKKLRAELKPGALIISNECPLENGWEPIEILETGVFKVKVYVYKQA